MVAACVSLLSRLTSHGFSTYSASHFSIQYTIFIFCIFASLFSRSRIHSIGFHSFPSSSASVVISYFLMLSSRLVIFFFIFISLVVTVSFFLFYANQNESKIFEEKPKNRQTFLFLIQEIVKKFENNSKNRRLKRRVKVFGVHNILRCNWFSFESVSVYLALKSEMETLLKFHFCQKKSAIELNTSV